MLLTATHKYWLQAHSYWHGRRHAYDHVSWIAAGVLLQSLSLASNIKIVDWVPQNDVLGHTAVQAFVTHSGGNSVYEAAYHGVPIVAVPLHSDQPDMAAKVQDGERLWILCICGYATPPSAPKKQITPCQQMH